jgi:hypothetical protein
MATNEPSTPAKSRSKTLLSVSVHKLTSLVDELSPSKSSRRKTFGKSENLPIMNIEKSRSLSLVYKTQSHQEVIKAERKRFSKIGAFSPSEIINSLARDEKLNKSYNDLDCIIFEKESKKTF